MDFRRYDYGSQPLLLAGAVFLLLFPLVSGAVIWLAGIYFLPVIYGIAGIYLIDLLVIGWICLNAWDKALLVDDNALQFENKFFKRVYRTKDIREIRLLANPAGREFLKIITKSKTHYLDEQYQPWDSLLVDLENITKKCNINSNLTE